MLEIVTCLVYLYAIVNLAKNMPQNDFFPLKHHSSVFRQDQSRKVYKIQEFNFLVQGLESCKNEDCTIFIFTQSCHKKFKK